jgi:ABC-type transporter Mla MlaB component
MEGETCSRDRVRVSGALTRPPLELLLDMVGRAEVMLDLSEVREVDSDAVRLLAQLAPDQHELLTCPKWLAARIEMERPPRSRTEAVGRVA